MKLSLFIFPLLLAAAQATESQPSAPTAAGPQDEYAQFMTQQMSPENMTDCIQTMDRLITEGEHGLMDKEPAQGVVEANTKLGLHFELTATQVKKEAIVYYLMLSRSGKVLKYQDAAKFAALFADRVALPHPFELIEGDKSTFYAQWLFKPSQWKTNQKLMLKYRATNRAETDPLKAFAFAVDREVQARSAARE